MANIIRRQRIAGKYHIFSFVGSCPITQCPVRGIRFLRSFSQLHILYAGRLSPMMDINRRKLIKSIIEARIILRQDWLPINSDGNVCVIPTQCPMHPRISCRRIGQVSIVQILAVTTDTNVITISAIIDPPLRTLISIEHNAAAGFRPLAGVISHVQFNGINASHAAVVIHFCTCMGIGAIFRSCCRIDRGVAFSRSIPELSTPLNSRQFNILNAHRLQPMIKLHRSRCCAKYITEISIILRQNRLAINRNRNMDTIPAQFPMHPFICSRCIREIGICQEVTIAADTNIVSVSSVINIPFHTAFRVENNTAAGFRCFCRIIANICFNAADTRHAATVGDLLIRVGIASQNGNTVFLCNLVCSGVPHRRNTLVHLNGTDTHGLTPLVELESRRTVKDIPTLRIVAGEDLLAVHKHINRGVVPAYFPMNPLLRFGRESQSAIGNIFTVSTNPDCIGIRTIVDIPLNPCGGIQDKSTAGFSPARLVVTNLCLH